MTTNERKPIVTAVHAADGRDTRLNRRQAAQGTRRNVQGVPKRDVFKPMSVLAEKHRFLKDPLVMGCAVVNITILVVFAGYVAWPRSRADGARHAAEIREVAIRPKWLEGSTGLQSLYKQRLTNPPKPDCPPSLERAAGAQLSPVESGAADQLAQTLNASPERSTSDPRRPIRPEGSSAGSRQQDAAQRRTVTVYVTNSGSKYHAAGCRHLAKSSIPMPLSDAAGQYGPCSVCRPPEGTSSRSAVASSGAARRGSSDRDAENKYTPPATASASPGTTATGIPLHVGPRGGVYHYSASGKKVYQRKKK